MRKIFFFFAAIMVAITMNATPVAPGTDALSAAISAAADGATIELAAGTFTQSSNFTISKNITIQAADEANKPLLEEGGSIYISGGVNVKFVNIDIKADGSHDVFDISAGGVFELDGCEVYNLGGRRAIKVGNTAHTDAIKINNCYMHGGTNYPVIEVESNSTQNGCDLVEIKNSTFADFTLGEKALIALNSKNGKPASDASGPDADVDLIVDHCTFYNFTKTKPDSGDGHVTWGCLDLRKSSKATVSNCIFANPSEIPSGHYAHRASQLYGGTVSNCLRYNTPNHRSDDITINNAIEGDPLFQDAANGDFTLTAGSPALDVLVNSERINLGDPRWVPAPKTIYCYVDKPWWKDGAATSCYAKVPDGPDNTWPGIAMTKVNDNLWKAEISAKYTKVNFTRVNPANVTEYWGAKTDELTIPVNSNLFTITSDDAQWDSDGNKAAGTWSVKDAKFYIAGSMTDWNNDKIGSLTDSYTLSLAAGKHQLKVVDNGNWLGMGSMTDVAGGLYPDASGAICLQLAAAGDVVVTFVKDGENIDTYTVTGDFTAPSVALAGEMTTWTAADLATYNFTPAENKKTASWKYTPTALPAGDSNFGFKVVFDGDQWLANNGYWITRENHTISALGPTGEGENLIFRPDVLNKAYTFTWTYATGTLDVTFPADTPSAIDNTSLDGQTVKFMENGQLFIRRDGKTYNVLGVTVR